MVVYGGVVYGLGLEVGSPRWCTEGTERERGFGGDGGSKLWRMYGGMGVGGGGPGVPRWV